MTGSWPVVPLFPVSSWYHAISTTVAALCALYVAYFLQLESPSSAVVTVLIVSSPLQGMIISKGIWRAVGTLVGAVVSVAMIAFFSQSSLFFFLSLALWLGLCTFTAALLRYFQAYAAVLSGYTVSIVALPAVQHPDQIFQIATSRLAVVIIGILCVAAVKGVFAIKIGQFRLKPALLGALKATTTLVREALGGAGENFIQQRRALGELLNSLDPLVHAAANETAVTAQSAPIARVFIATLLNMLMIASKLRDDLAKIHDRAPLEPALALMNRIFLTVRTAEALLGEETKNALDDARSTFPDLVTTIAKTPSPETLATLTILAHLDDLMDELTQARYYFGALEQGKAPRRVTPVSYHRDAHQAVVAGLRAAAAVMIAGAFWIVTGWSQGATMLGALLPVCALFGAADRPDQASIAFMWGMMLSAIVASFYVFVVLPKITGFPLLAVCLAPYIILGCLASTIPKYANSAQAFLIFTMAFMSPGNPVTYDLVTFLNSVVALLVGGLFGVLTFKILWPVDPEAAIRRLVRAMLDDLGNLARDRKMTIELSGWERRMQDRLARLGSRLAASDRRPRAIEAGLATILLGREITRARLILATMALGHDIESAIVALRQEVSDLAAGQRVEGAAAFQVAALLSERTSSDEENAAKLYRLSAVFQEIGKTLASYGTFLADTAFQKPIVIS